MEDKSNSLSRVKRHQREKVLRFSIRKYSFGAASVAVAALMFMGANVVSADSPSQNTSSSTTGLASPKDGEQSSEAGQERDENQAEIASEPSANNEAQPAEEKAATVDNSRLSKLVEEVSALLSTDSKHDSSVVSPIKERLQKGKELLARADAGQGELDSLAEKLEKDLAVLSSSSKEESQPQGSESADKSSSSETSDPKEEGTDRAASASGSENKPRRRSRRALESVPNTVNEGALANVRYYASVDPEENSGNKKRNDEPEFTKNKTDIKATYVQDNEGKWIVYDVYFNNDGHRMVRSSYQQHYYFLGPFNIMDLNSNGTYKSNTIKDLRFTRYSNTGGRRLSDGGQGFTQKGNTAVITSPAHQKERIFDDDRRTFYDPNSGVTGNSKQLWEVFKHNQDDSDLNLLTKDKNGNYPRYSYFLGVDVRNNSTDYAMHMHAKIKLRDDVTFEEATQYGHVFAASVTKGPTTQQSYIVGAKGARLQSDPEAPKDPIQGLTVTKTVGDDEGDSSNPVSSGYVKHKNGGTFPPGMNWTWAGDKLPSTAQAGVFKYISIATYKDGSKSTDAGSGSDGTVTLIVKPKKPAITTDVANKKGLPNQQITVNVGNGVPNGSTVKLYDGNTVIGTGTTNGQTATVTVAEALPGNPITAETVVNNGGTVTSDRSNPVTPTPKPDTQPPTLTVTPAEQTVKVGEKILFNVNGQDDTKVNLGFSDIFTKYPNHLFTQQTIYSVNTDKQKTLSIDLGAAQETDIGEKTVTVKATDDAGHEISKTVKVKVVPATKENEKHNPTAETLEIGIKQELTDEAIKAKVKNYPSNATLSVKQKPDTDTTGNKTATVIVTYSDKSTDEVTVPVVVRDTTPPKIYWAKDDGSKVELGKTHAEGQNIVIPLYRGDAVNTRLITTDDSGKVTNFKTENLQSGFNFTPVSGTATEGSPLGQNVTGTVGLGVAKGKYTGRAISTDGTNTTTGFFVFDVHEQAEKYTPAANTLTVPFNHTITDDEVKGKVIAKPGTPAFPNGTIFEVVSKPETNTAGTDKKAVVKITYPDKSTENIDVPVHVGKDLASQHPLEGQTVTVTVGDSLKTWKGRVDSNQYTNAPKGRGNGVEWGWKGTTPKVVQDTAGVFKYTATATHTDKSVAESNPQVTVIVKPKAPMIETDLTGKSNQENVPVTVSVGEGVKDGSIVTLYGPDETTVIGTGTVTNGKATAIITGKVPVGNITAKTTVQTPGQDNVVSEPSPIKEATNIVPTAKTQTVGLKEQPNAKNSIGNNGDLPNGTDYKWKTTPDTSTPGDKPGIVTVTYPDGSTIDVPVTVDVTTP
ncbi:Rib/alpha-like domain-containing protein, partial [Streptococcus sp. 3613]|uniref:Rib/alpha-like domain-containing protein n=1 Tax=Streptococcus sp. 3613 TaxID=2582639 RepID=UPI001561F32D